MTSTDMRALGRLGHTRDRSGGRRRRRLDRRSVRGVPAVTARPRLSRPVAAVVVLLLCGFTYVGATAAQQAGPGGTLAAIPALSASDDAVVEGRHDRAERASRSGGLPSAGGDAGAPLAGVEGLELSLPHARPVLVAFHEASLAEALTLTPIGSLAANDNPTKFDGGREADGPVYHVLASRGRPRAATSAVDVVVPTGETVTAPVTGTVVEAREYALYGSTRDWRVVIEPRANPDLQVVLIHLHQPSVEVGDEVDAGRSPIAVARQLPFTSQVDNVTGESLPHVHLEVKAATAPKPIDPNQPAVEPGDALDLSSG